MSLWGPAMFFGVLAMIFTGYPVAFALGGTALVFALVGWAVGVFDPVLLYALPERTFGTMSNATLLAVPFFIFMGAVLEKSKLAEELLETIGMLFGRFRGGLGIGVVLVGALLAAATGVVGASVTAMGLISLPVMLRHGYRREISLGTIAAAGTLGQIIPPSIVLIVLGDQMGVSVGDLFRSALVPGLALTGAYVVWIAGVAFFNEDVAPALPEELRESGLPLLRRVVVSLVPPLVLIVVVLGSIFAGIATPTEAGALGAIGAMALAAANRSLSLGALERAMEETSRLTIMVVFLLIGSTAFSLVFRGFNGDLWIEGTLTGIPGGALGFLIVVNLVVFFLGFFIDFFEIAFIIVPLVVPAARTLGIDVTWLGIVLALNLQTSFLTPPFGFSLFYLRGVTPTEISTTSIYRGVVPFIAIQLVVLGALVWIVVPREGGGFRGGEGGMELKTIWTGGRRKLGKDPHFRPWVERVGTIRLPVWPDDPFVYLARAIVFQQLAGAAARTIHGRFVEALGGDVRAAKVKRVRDTTLRKAGLSANKIAAIRDLAAKVDSGEVDVSDLDEQPDEEVVRRLTLVRGIGPWTAHMYLMFRLHRPDVWPTGDLGVRSGYAKIHALDEAPAQKELEPLGEAYRPWRSAAAFYCWRALETELP